MTDNGMIEAFRNDGGEVSLQQQKREQ